MGCCNGKHADGDWGEDDLDLEVRALIQDRDAAGNPITVALTVDADLTDDAAAAAPPGAQYFAVFFEGAREQTLTGRTESTQLDRDNRASFTSAVHMQYKFEKVQVVVIRVYRENDRLATLDQQELIGELETEMGDLWGLSPYEDRIVDTAMNYTGTVTVRTEEVKSATVQDEVVAVLTVSQLEGGRAQQTKHVFVTVSRVLDQELVMVAKTERRAHNTKDRESVTEFLPLHVKVDRLCSGDYKALLVMSLFSWDPGGKQSLIGAAHCTLETLLSGGFEHFELVDPVKRSVTNYGHSGYILVKEIRVEKTHTFLDFVRAGFEINMTVAIDFTKSNRSFDNDKSLHYRRSDNKTNEYMAAIQAVGSVMCGYDKDQEFPVYGFGARLPNGSISQCFPCTLSYESIEVSGLDGIAECYWNCLKEVEPIEPTNLSPVIRKVTETAKRSAEEGKLSYQLLLIITDGLISDMRQTIEAVVAASRQPISILIVGVGSGSDHFHKMKILDADDEPLTSSEGEVMHRDIVGFVPFREHRNNPDILARECLREIPKQFTTWTRLNKVELPDSTQKAPGHKRARLSRRIFTDNPDALPEADLKAIGTKSNHGMQALKRKVHRLTLTTRSARGASSVDGQAESLARPFLNAGSLGVNAGGRREASGGGTPLSGLDARCAVLPPSGATSPISPGLKKKVSLDTVPRTPRDNKYDLL
ncbi:Copine-D [Diplonema papillatum]|nr:Copine-D [Diplonema papillatum]